MENGIIDEKDTEYAPLKLHITNKTERKISKSVTISFDEI